jgi:hypothetical protein
MYIGLPDVHRRSVQYAPGVVSPHRANALCNEHREWLSVPLTTDNPGRSASRTRLIMSICHNSNGRGRSQLRQSSSRRFRRCRPIRWPFWPGSERVPAIKSARFMLRSDENAAGQSTGSFLYEDDRLVEQRCRPVMPPILKAFVKRSGPIHVAWRISDQVPAAGRVRPSENARRPASLQRCPGCFCDLWSQSPKVPTVSLW